MSIDDTLPSSVKVIHLTAEGLEEIKKGKCFNDLKRGVHYFLFMEINYSFPIQDKMGGELKRDLEYLKERFRNVYRDKVVVENYINGVKR